MQRSAVKGQVRPVRNRHQFNHKRLAEGSIFCHEIWGVICHSLLDEEAGFEIDGPRVCVRRAEQLHPPRVSRERQRRSAELLRFFSWDGSGPGSFQRVVGCSRKHGTSWEVYMKGFETRRCIESVQPGNLMSILF